MFLNVTLENVFGISNLIKLDFVGIPKKREKKNTVYAAEKGLNINKIVGIIGPNASGKSSILNSIASVGEFLENDINMVDIKYSDNEKKNLSFDVSSFLPNQYNVEKDSLIDVELYIPNGEIPGFYKYSLIYSSIVNNDTKIIEKLFYKDKYKKSWNIILDINFKEYKSDIGYKCRHYESIINDYKDVSPQLLDNFENKMKYYKTFYKHYLDKSYSQLTDEIISPISELYLEHWLKTDKEKVNEIIKYVDKNIKEIDIIVKEDEEKIVITTFNDKIIDFYSISQGTRKFLMLMYNIFLVINREGIILCEEIENSLHIDLVRFILKMFTIEDNAAQIIFTSNSELTMDESIMRNDQIYILDKHDRNITAYKFSEIYNRYDASFRKAYSTKVVSKQQPNIKEIDEFIKNFDSNKMKDYRRVKYILKRLNKKN